MDEMRHLDMVVTDQNHTSIFSGATQTALSPRFPLAAHLLADQAVMLAVFDFIRGIPDFATATANGVSFLLGQGNLTYAPPVPYSGSPSPIGAAYGRLQWDGYQTLLNSRLVELQSSLEPQGLFER